MGIIAAMPREPDMANRIQGLSIPEIKDGLARVLLRVSRDVKFRERKLRAGPMLNAVVVHFLTLDEASQDAIVADGLKRFEELLSHDEPRDDLVSPSAGDPPADPPGRGESRELPTAVWNRRVTGKGKVAKSGDNVGERLHGDDEPVRKGRHSPRRK